MDRRRFVKSVGCAGTLAAATQLPAGASCMDEMMRFSQNRPSAHGMGYVVLDKDKTFAEQVTQENAIYEIRYDFDLGGKAIPIPKGSIFDFKGGSIGNGELLISNTAAYNYDSLYIQAPAYRIFQENLDISGEFASDRICIEWFGAVGDGKTDCTDAFRRALKMCGGKNVRKGADGNNVEIEYGKGYAIYLNNNRTYIVNGTINFYDGKYHDVKRIALVGDKATQSEAYPAYENRSNCIFLKKANTSLFAQADIISLKLENLSITGEWVDWVKAGIKIFDDCLIKGLLLKECHISFIHSLFYETGIWAVSRIHGNHLIGVYNFSYQSKAEGKKTHFVDSSIYNNYINGGAPITKLDDGTPRCPLIDNSFFAWNACNGSEIHHNFIDYYACVYNCKLIYGNINSNHNHYQVFKYFHKDVTLYSFNDYFNWNDGEKDVIKDVMSRFSVETYEGKDGKTYNVPNYIASDRYYGKNVVIKDAVIEENIKNIIFRTGIGDGFKNPGKKFIVSLYDRAANRENAIVYKEGAEYPVFLPISIKYDISIDKKLVHEYKEMPANLNSGAWGKIGIGEYVIVGNNLYQMSCYTDGENIVDYGLVKVLPLGWVNKS